MREPDAVRRGSVAGGDASEWRSVPESQEDAADGFITSLAGWRAGAKACRRSQPKR